MRKLLTFYAKLFRRSFLKNKMHFLLNLAGLTLGISCFLLALLYVFYETSYDSYHVNRDRIGRIVSVLETGGSVTHTALSNDFLTPNLPKLYPEIETMVRYKAFDGKAAIRVENGVVAARAQGIAFGQAVLFRSGCFQGIQLFIGGRGQGKLSFGSEYDCT